MDDTDLGRNRGNIYIRADNRRIVPAPDSSVFAPGSRQPTRAYNSSVTLLSVCAQLCMTLMPVAVEPVNDTLSTPGAAVSHGPRLSSPLKTWTTPGGKKC